MITCPMHPNDPPHPQCDESCQYHCAHAAKEKADDRLAGTTCSQSRYPFVNNQGKVIWIEGKTTIPELLKMGVENISLEPQGSPMPKDVHIYVHAVTEND